MLKRSDQETLWSRMNKSALIQELLKMQNDLDVANMQRRAAEDMRLQAVKELGELRYTHSTVSTQLGRERNIVDALTRR